MSNIEHDYSNPADYKNLVVRICNNYCHNVEHDNGYWYVTKMYSNNVWRRYSDLHPREADRFRFTDELEAWAYCLYLATLDLF